MNVAAYLERIGYRGPAEPTVETLRALVAAHNGSIPFENLDPLMGIPVADLSVAALTDKLVHRRRGGYCYEHNGLMDMCSRSWALASSGLPVAWCG
jgi:arylamine N-acetyltransferase